MGEFARQRQKRWSNHGGAGKEEVGLVRKSAPLPARARPHCAFRRSLALLATLLAASACDNSSEPDLVPAPEFRPCVDYGDHLGITGRMMLDGHGEDLLVANGYLYVALSNRIEVFDLSNADAPVAISTIDIPARYLAMAEGSRLCVASGRQLSVVDALNPVGPVLESTINLPTLIEGIAAQGNGAYLAAGALGLWIVDVSAGSQPRIMGSVDTPQYARAVGVSGKLALVAGADNQESAGLHVIDVSNPASPQRIGFVGDVFGRTVEMEEQVAYLCGLAFETFAVDISIPSTPSVISALPLGADQIVVEGDRAYTCGPRFTAQSIVNPASPVVLGTIDIQSDAIAVDGDRAYLLNSGGIIDVVDITNPRPPQPLARVGLQVITRRLAARDNRIFLCTTGGLVAFDATNQMPAIEWRAPMLAFDVALDDNRAYVAAFGDGLKIVDTETSGPNRVIGGIDLPGRATGITVDQGHAYVVLDGYGLWIVDVSDPAQCRIIGSVDTPGGAYDVAFRNPFAYVTDSISGLVVVDTSVPVSPRIVNSVNNPYFNDATAIALSGDFAYVASQRSGLGVFDVSQPDKPDFVTNVASHGNWLDIAIEGTIVYLAGDEEVLVVDVTNPYSPVIEGSARGAFIYAVAVDGDRVYISNNAGLTVFPHHCESSEKQP